MVSGAASLTEREREVLRLLLAGHTAKSAAVQLDLSVHTINDYLREARKKLGVTSSKEAARILAGSEASPPNNDAPQSIGMAPAAPADHNRALSEGNAARRGRTALIIGAIIMLGTIIAAALAISAGGDTVSEAEPVSASLPADDRAAAAAAQNWIKLIDESAWQESWVESASYFQSAVTADQWTTTASSVREPLGAVVMRKVETIERRGELPGAPAGDYQIVQFGTDFAETKARAETVILVSEAGEWKVVGYFIR